MSLADSVYDEGARAYQAGDYPAAETSFRQLLELVPPSEVKAYGRAAYSLALTLIKQHRTEEAKQALRLALRVDPGLQRAQERLAELDRRLPSPTTAGGFVGTARGVRITTEPHAMFGGQRNVVLRFRVEGQGTAGSGARTIEMRGSRLEGSVEDGDVIEVPGNRQPSGRGNYVLNVSTGETVRAAGSGIRIVQWVVLLLFLVAFVVFASWVFSNM